VKYPIVIAAVSLVGAMTSGCDNKEGSKAAVAISREELVAHGFKESASEPGNFVATSVRLDAVAKALGFSIGSLRPTVSQGRHSDIRDGEYRGASVLVIAEAGPSGGRVARGALDNPETICTVHVSLRAYPKTPAAEYAMKALANWSIAT
jgi:hypothetical protein